MSSPGDQFVSRSKNDDDSPNLVEDKLASSAISTSANNASDDKLVEDKGTSATSCSPRTQGDNDDDQNSVNVAGKREEAIANSLTGNDQNDDSDSLVVRTPTFADVVETEGYEGDQSAEESEDSSEPCKKLPRLQVTIQSRYLSDSDSDYEVHNHFHHDYHYYSKFGLVSGSHAYSNHCNPYQDSGLLDNSNDDDRTFNPSIDHNYHYHQVDRFNHNHMYNNYPRYAWHRPEEDELRNWFTVSTLLQYLANDYNEKSKDANFSSADYLKGVRDLLQRFNIYADLNEPEAEKPEQLLDIVTFEGVVNYIKLQRCKNIIVMAGAGISTSAGIPDFRTPGTGLYDNLQKYDLPDPESIFKLSYFCDNPYPFYSLAKELYPGRYRPTICHYFIKLLVDKDLLLRHFTQNIDTLEHLAGVPNEKIIEAHGSFNSAHCINYQCHMEYSSDWVKEQIFNDKIPQCSKCKNLVKPDIVFFGESLPARFFHATREDFPKCDLLIIMGTSLKVQPFASLIDRVPETTPRLLINLEKSGKRHELFGALGIKEGLAYGCEDNYRDVFWQGTCDEGCLALAEALGWKEELLQLKEIGDKELNEKYGHFQPSETVPSKATQTSENLETKPETDENASAALGESASSNANLTTPLTKDSVNTE